MLKKAILLLVIFTIVSSNETPYQKALSSFKLGIGTLIKPYPPNYINYVKNLKVDVEVLVTSNEKILIPKCNGDKQCLNNIEQTQFSDKSYFSSLNKQKNANTLIGAIEYSFKTERVDNVVYYCFYKAKFNGNIVEQIEKFTAKKCKRVIFWTKCENYEIKRPRKLNIKEVEIVDNAARTALNIEILAKLNKLK